jgi:hypothetical protein
VHQIFPGGELALAQNVHWNFGVGFGLTPAGEKLIYKTRFEFSFGKRGKD